MRDVSLPDVHPASLLEYCIGGMTRQEDLVEKTRSGERGRTRSPKEDKNIRALPPIEDILKEGNQGRRKEGVGGGRSSIQSESVTDKGTRDEIRLGEALRGGGSEVGKRFWGGRSTRI